MVQVITAFVFIFFVIRVIMVVINIKQKKKLLQNKLEEVFPSVWRARLQKDVRFYVELENTDKIIFEKRIQLFLATKSIEGIEVELNDELRLLVACSAVIPTFAFPGYNYPYVHSVLIYPGSFNLKFETKESQDPKKNILGLVGSNIQNGTVILSQPDLLLAFDGTVHKENVGIHEFVHLLDKEDGEIDGIPKMLMENSYVGPWLREIKNEIKRIEKGNSDINPYALASNAEFLAVVSEYFFSNPDKFKRKHAELFGYLSHIYNRL